MARPTTYVTLKIEAYFFKEVQTIMKKDHYISYDENVVNGIWSIDFEQVSNGEIEFLPQLQKLGIAYDSVWEREYDIEPGGEYCRFTDTGEMVLKTMYESERLIGINTIKEIIYDEYLKDNLTQLIDQIEERVSVLPWHNQVEYGKLHRVNQLLLPT